MIHHDRRNSVEVLRLEHGKVQAIDLELLRDIEASLDRVDQGDASAVVMTGTGSSFSAGVNLFRIVESDKAYVTEFLAALTRTLHRIFAYPRPIVAALNGHAIAGGCVVAAACDHRLMARGGGKIGVTELLVGVPFPVAALESMRHLLPAAVLQDLVLSGRTVGPEEALQLGLVQELSDPPELMPAAIAVAEQFGRIPRAAFVHSKMQLRAPALDRMRDTAPDAAMAAVWSAPETAAAIRDYLARTVGRKS
ncbi:MAG: enoyl-CoA hydratase/isomerase family protein [Acidobacteriota bacterium]